MQRGMTNKIIKNKSYSVNRSFSKKMSKISLEINNRRNSIKNKKVFYKTKILLMKREK